MHVQLLQNVQSAFYARGPCLVQNLKRGILSDFEESKGQKHILQSASRDITTTEHLMIQEIQKVSMQGMNLGVFKDVSHSKYHKACTDFILT